MLDDDGEYNDGDIVWVKLSYCWWPGEVMAGDRLTEEFLSTLKRRPLAVVKFFEEDSYEFVKNTNFIYKYNCGRKNEFLRKGLEQYRAKNKHMEKFPADVMHAERATGGDPNIVNSNDFLPQKRESYASIFGGKSKGKASAGSKSPVKNVVSPSKVIPVIPVKKHEVRILGQASSLTGLSTASRSLLSSLGPTSSLPTTPRPLNSAAGAVNSSSNSSPSQIYHCHKCGFESGRQNVIVIHTKYCRASSMNVTPVKVVKDVKPPVVTPEKSEKEPTPRESPQTPIKVEEPQASIQATIEETIEKIVEGEELVEVIQVLEPPKPTRGHASRTPRASAPAAKTTPKSDRRRNRGKGRKAAPTSVADDGDEKVEVLMEVAEEEGKGEKEKSEEEAAKEQTSVQAPVDVETKPVDVSVEKEDKDQDSKIKGELKNELLADWSEDEQDDPEDPVKEDKHANDGQSEKTEPTENVTIVAASSLETSLDKSVECSPQLASPVSSATTIKYRNIPKKQKREFIEVTNDQPVVPVASTIEKSSSESSISTTAATCGGDTPSTSDKTLTSVDSFAERPISAKQRILDRATRGSSKSVSSSEEAKQESLMKVVSLESHPVAEEESKKETSCFDFQEDEEEEVVLNKSPRRSLSNRRDTSLELNSTVPDLVKAQEEQERAKKDAELKTEIESLLSEASIPSLPEVPKIARAPSPVPSSSSSAAETTPQLKDEIDRNRTLPPKERGKRIFKTRNKIIENEAIALEQSKAIVMDFVKKSHEEEMAELREQQQRAEAKMSSESPTTINDDSQESVLSNEPVAARFEKSQFAAIKSKRTKILTMAVVNKASVAQEPSVSSTNEAAKATEPMDCLPLTVNKDQLALDSSQALAATPKGRKGKQRKSATTPVVEKPIAEEVPEVEQKQPEPRIGDTATPKSKKKRGGELEKLDLRALDTPRSRRGKSVKVEEEPVKVVDEPVVAPAPAHTNRQSEQAKEEEEQVKLVEEPVVALASTERHRQSKQAKEEKPAQAVDEPVVAPVPAKKHRQSKKAKEEEEQTQVVDEPVVALAFAKKHRQSKKAKEEEVLAQVVDVPVVAPASAEWNRQSKQPKEEEESAQVINEPIVAPASAEKHSPSQEAKEEEETAKVADEPIVAPASAKKHRQSKQAKEQKSAQVVDDSVVAPAFVEWNRQSKQTKEEEPAQVVDKPALEPASEESHQFKQVTEEEESAKVVNEPVAAIPASTKKHRQAKQAKEEKEPVKLVDEPVVVSPVSSERHLQAKQAKEEEEPTKVIDEPVIAAVSAKKHRQSKQAKLVEEPVNTVDEPIVPPASSERHHQSEQAKEDEEPAKVADESVVSHASTKRYRQSKQANEQKEPAKMVDEPVVAPVSAEWNSQSKEAKGEEELTQVVDEPVVALDSIKKHRQSKQAKQEKEPVKLVDEPVVSPASSKRHRQSKQAKQEEELAQVVDEPVVRSASTERHRQSEQAKTEEEAAKVADEPVVSHASSERHHQSKQAKEEEEPAEVVDERVVSHASVKRYRKSKQAKTEEESAQVVDEPVVPSTSAESHRQSKQALEGEESTEAIDEPVVSHASARRYRQSKQAKEKEEPAQVVDEPVVPFTSAERLRQSKRAMEEEEPGKVINEPVVSPVSAKRHRQSKQAKQEEEARKETVEKQPTPVVDEPKTPKQKRFHHQLQQGSADSTAEIIPETHEEPAAVSSSEKVESSVPKEPAPPEPTPPIKHQPIKMIIKSKGRKSNSELLYEHTVVSPEPKEDVVKAKLPKSPKSSKRKKVPADEPVEPLLVESPPEDATSELPTAIKLPKSKRAKLRTEELSAKVSDNKIYEDTTAPSTSHLLVSTTGPSATDLQIAEALIHLPDVTPPPKPVVVVIHDQDKSNSSSSPIPTIPVVVAAPATAKTINPRKRHLQTLMSSPELVATEKPQPEPVPVTIPEKKMRETVSAPVKESPATESANASQKVDEDKFDIDNIPIVMDNVSELMDDSAVSTTNNQKLSSETSQPTISRPMTKKMIIVKNSNGSSRIVSSKESPPREIRSPVQKKHPVSVKPAPADQPISPTHSPPVRGAKLVQASSVGQIVITSKGTVLTTSSPSRSSRTGGASKTHVTPAKTAAGNVVSSVSTISSSTSDSPPKSAASGTSLKLTVQSQRSKAVDLAIGHKKTLASSTSSPKKALMKKHSDAASSSSSSSGKPLFATSKGAPIKPQPATSSTVGSGKKPHKVIKISPQKLKEFTRLGMVEDKGQGKVLTASGMKKFRQEQNQLQQQQQQKPPQHPAEEAKKTLRADSVDEEPSTSTPTPPPPAETPAEVVIAAAADSSVKEIPSTPPTEAEELSDPSVAASSIESLEKPPSPAVLVLQTPSTEPTSTEEENEADAAILQEPPSSSPTAAVADEPSESATSAAAAIPVAMEAEAATESGGSNASSESSQLIAVPAENFGGPANLFYLCAVREEGFVPVNNELLYLDSSNQLVALPEHASVEDIIASQAAAEVLEIPAGSEQATVVAAAAAVDGEGNVEVGQQNILLNTQDGQQIILDQQSLMALAAGGDTSQLLTPDGQQILLQGSAQELLAALAVSQPGLGIVAAEGTQIIVAPESLIELQDSPLPGEIIQVNPNTTVETNAVLTKPPIMSAVEVPTKNGNGAEASSASSPEHRPLEPASTNLDESLAAVIGVPSNPNVPTSLELPITVTNPVIAKTTTCKINPIYPPTTAMSAMALDPAAVAAAAAIGGLPMAVAQTGTDSSHDETTQQHETNSSSDDTTKNTSKDEKHPPVPSETGSEKLNGKTIDEEDEENRDLNAENDLDEIIPNTPESQMNSHAEISSQFSDDDSEAPVPIPNVGEDEDDEDDRGSNCSEIIPIQPNVVIVRRSLNNELLSNNNDNDDNNASSDMEIDNPINPSSAAGNEENNPNPSSHSTEDVADFGSPNNNNCTVIER